MPSAGKKIYQLFGNSFALSVKKNTNFILVNVGIFAVTSTRDVVK